MDTYEGDDDDPLSLHKYLYTNANPVDGLDPSGNDDLAGVMMAASVSVSLDAMASIQQKGVMKAITQIPVYPGTLEARQLVGAVYAESSSHFWPRKNPGEFPDEKIAIAQTFINEAYFASIYPKDDGGKRNWGNGTILSAITKSSSAVGSDQWNEVMQGNDLKDPKVLDSTLTDNYKRMHFQLSVVAVDEVYGGANIGFLDDLNGRAPIAFNKASNTPPNPSRQEKIGKAGNHTFYGFIPGAEGKR